jgi:hypothetical protein
MLSLVPSMPSEFRASYKMIFNNSDDIVGIMDGSILPLVWEPSIPRFADYKGIICSFHLNGEMVFERRINVHIILMRWGVLDTVSR